MTQKTQKTKKYYKICYVDYDRNLHSYAKSRLHQVDSHLPVMYKLNEWNYPNVKDTKLMVFDSLEHAKKWIHDDSASRSQNKIFECEVKNPVKRSMFYVISGWVNPSNVTVRMQECIKLKKNRKAYLHKCEKPPQGTIFVSAVKLIKEVK